MKPKLGRLVLALLALVLATIPLISCAAGKAAYAVPEATTLLPPEKQNYTVARGYTNDFQLEQTGASAQPKGADWDLPDGHFFTQTGGGSGRGYAVIDDGSARFWSEFKRLGGVQSVGYPASQRFQWDGFTVQVFQRVVFQWRPEAGSVAFVNVFDRLGDLGKDEWLTNSKSVPRPRKFEDAGLGWSQVVQGHTSVMDAYPAIKSSYYSVVGDAVNANGLPMSDVQDMGNHFALRAQRVVFQQWKSDVPWAKAGQVTVALGGDMAKEAGILPSQDALQPIVPPGGSATTGPVKYALHKDAEKEFKFPLGWKPETVQQYGTSHNYYVSPSGGAAIYFLAPYGMGGDFKMEDFVVTFIHAMQGRGNFIPMEQANWSVDGSRALVQWYSVTGKNPMRGVAMTTQRGKYLFYIGVMAAPELWPEYEPVLTEVLKSYRIHQTQ